MDSAESLVAVNIGDQSSVDVFSGSTLKLLSSGGIFNVTGTTGISTFNGA